jgi:hypothetical protein
MCEPYQGYPNRETWGVSLWMNNDEGIYHEVREMASRAREQEPEEEFLSARTILAREIKDMWEQFQNPDLDEIDATSWVRNVLPMLNDIGSLYRVDWDHIAENVLSED